MKSFQNLKSKFENIDWKNEEFQKNFLMTKDINIDENIKNIVNCILPYVTNYIGSLPVILSAGFWHSPNKENQPGRSQSWHFDVEDKKQLKVLIPIEKISLSNGPLTVLPAEKSQFIFDKLYKSKKSKSKTNKINDDIIKPFKVDEVPLTGDEGDIIFCDTSRCYHYGSRKSSKPRKLIALHFSSAFCIDVPFLFRKYDKSENIYSRTQQLIYGLEDYYLPKLRNKLKNNDKSAIKSIMFN